MMLKDLLTVANETLLLGLCLFVMAGIATGGNLI